MPIGDISSIKETAYGFRSKLKFFIDCIELLRQKFGKQKKDMNILDVGCGNGIQMTFPLAAQGYCVTGIDFHKSSIEFAQANNVFANANFILSDIKKLKCEMAGKKIDAIVFSDILEHVSDPLALMIEAKELLSPQGIVLISIPNGYGPFEIENFILRKTGAIKVGRFLRNFLAALKSREKIPYNAESGHVQFFTQRKFNKLLNNAGLIVAEFRRGCFLGGSISNAIISKIRFLEKLNIKIAKYLPAKICSVWYFECKIL